MSQPFYFSFDTRTKPGKMLCHRVIVDTVTLDEANPSKLSILGCTATQDKRVADLLWHGYVYVKQHPEEFVKRLRAHATEGGRK